MFEFVVNSIPRTVKNALAKNRRLVFALYAMRSLLKFNLLDRVLVRLLGRIDEPEKALSIVKEHQSEVEYCQLMINIEPEKAKSIIIEHRRDIRYCRLLERAERYKALGEKANERRLDFEADKYNHLIKVSEELVDKFPEDYLLHDRLARNYLGGGYQKKAIYHFFESLKLQRKRKLLEGKTGIIFIAGMHRSGNGYTKRALLNGLGMKDIKGSIIRYYDGYYPNFGIIDFPDYVSHWAFSPMPDGIISSHAGALEANLKNLALITDKLIVTVRDPRQAFISKVHYAEYLRYTGNVSGLMENQYPDGYFQWPFEKKIDWQIDNYFFPADLKWLQGWLEADADPEFLCNIHFSLYEILAKNPKRYFQEILLFYGLPEDRFTYPKKPEFKPKTPLRKGSTDEWMEVLSRKQIQKMNKAMPEEWFEKFKWVKLPG
ncbi:MAG: sulfotransferase domain-containing protein [Deltaproteobacteria bacterium]|nr:sulfotransferase domain-containing protein [Deltaproteobacteria bacterium]